MPLQDMEQQGMIVPKYWAEAKVSERKKRKSFTVRRFGWSDISPEDAQRNADERAAQALTRIVAGEKLDRRDRKIAYNGAQGIPIREEIVASYGETIITRNSYGARCLNTPNVLFADIDCDQPTNKTLKNVLRIALVSLAIAFGVWQQHIGVLIGSAALALVLASILSRTLQNLWIIANGGTRRFLQNKVRRFVDQHPHWHVRIYRTPAGLRVLTLHRTFDPREPEVTQFFSRLGTDALYARMCANQNCFRARLSAKPWRIGISGHMKPRPGVWPISPERVADRQRWIDSYEIAATGFAACHFIEELGSKTIDPAADEVRKLHDEQSGATRNMPIA